MPGEALDVIARGTGRLDCFMRRGVRTRPPRAIATSAPGGTLQLRTIVALAFTLIFLVSSGALAWLDRRATSQLLEQRVDEQFAALARGVASEVSAEFDSANAVLDTLSVAPPPLSEPERAGSILARVLAELRKAAPSVEALIAACADGTYVQVEHLGDEAGKTRTYQLRFGRAVDGRAAETAVALDGGFDVSSIARRAVYPYDPRIGPWYRAAAGTPAGVTTPRYLFRRSRHFGLTLSRRAGSDPGTVFGVSMRLDGVSASLRRAVAFGGERLSIFDADGALLGASDQLGRDGPDAGRGAGDVQAPGRQDPAAEVYAVHLRDPSARSQDLVVDGRPVHATITPFAVNGAAMVLVSTVPAELFRAPAARLLFWSFLFQTSIVLAAGLLVWTASRTVSRPIAALARDVERISTFDFPTRPRTASRIREVQRLLAAVDLLELTLRTLSTHLPHSFVRDLLDRGSTPTLGGTRLPIIVLFTDIEGFTGIAEAAAPDDLMSQLSRHFAAIGDEVLASGGTLDKFTGDGVMAFWPLDAGPDGAVAVCQAVLRMVERVEVLNAAFTAEGRPPLAARFGLHAGEAMVGSIGTANRMNYTALGHTVNVASRIEQLNKAHGTRVLISAAVHQATGHKVRVRFVGTAAVRGAKALIDVLELLA